MAKAPKVTITTGKGGGGGARPVEDVDDRIPLDIQSAAIDRARNHLISRLRRLIIEGVHSAFDPGAVYRTVRDIQALDMIRATQPDARSAPTPVQTVEDAAEAQRKAHDAHKAEEIRKAARGD